MIVPKENLVQAGTKGLESIVGTCRDPHLISEAMKSLGTVRCSFDHLQYYFLMNLYNNKRDSTVYRTLVLYTNLAWFKSHCPI